MAKQSGQFCGTATGIKRSLKNIKTEVFFGGGRSARAIGIIDQTPEKSRSNRLVLNAWTCDNILGKKRTRFRFSVCPVTCPVMRWTSIALFTAIDCTDFELGGGWREGRSGDRLDPTAPK
ncbi:MAG TPA: hypothetical protein VIQ31_37580 [Phormidium sp.]